MLVSWPQSEAEVINLHNWFSEKFWMYHEMHHIRKGIALSFCCSSVNAFWGVYYSMRLILVLRLLETVFVICRNELWEQWSDIKPSLAVTLALLGRTEVSCLKNSFQVGVEMFISGLPSLCIDVNYDKNERQNRLTVLELVLNTKPIQLQIFLILPIYFLCEITKN